MALNLTLADRSPISIQVIDFQGRIVTRLLEKTINAGAHSFIWDIRENSNTSIPDGMYFLQIIMDRQVITRKAIHVN